MKKVLFCGCSYVYGLGFELERNEPNLWVNLLKSQGKFKNFELINTSWPGRSNSGIFQDAVYNLTNNNYDYAVIAWTSIPRFEFELGIETYTTKQVFIPNGPCQNIGLNNVMYTKAYLEEIRDRFLSLVCDHYEIVNLVYYVNALVNLSNKLGTKIFFVNSLCPWDQNYFTKLTDVLPNKYTDYTKKLINVDNRDDKETFAIYNKMHDQYNQSGNIQEKHWLNLYNSLRSLQVDFNNDSLHPGIKSNQIYFELLNQSIEL